MNSKIIRNRIELGLPKLFYTFKKIKNHSHFIDLYPEYLRVLHGMIRASVPLMEDALHKSKSLPKSDPLAKMMCDYFEDHIEEERDHDVWLLEDLDSLGIDREEILRKLTQPAIAAMIGAQYYWIRHHHPVALLGHLTVSEGYPPSKEELIKLSEQVSLPITGFRTLIKHSELDLLHKQEFDNFLNKAALTKEQISTICISAMTTIRFAVEAFSNLVDNYPSYEEMKKKPADVTTNKTK